MTNFFSKKVVEVGGVREGSVFTLLKQTKLTLNIIQKLTEWHSYIYSRHGGQS